MFWLVLDIMLAHDHYFPDLDSYVAVMHSVLLVEKSLNYRLYTTVYSDQWVKSFKRINHLMLVLYQIWQTELYRMTKTTSLGEFQQWQQLNWFATVTRKENDYIIKKSNFHNNIKHKFGNHNFLLILSRCLDSKSVLTCPEIELTLIMPPNLRSDAWLPWSILHIGAWSFLFLLPVWC